MPQCVRSCGWLCRWLKYVGYGDWLDGSAVYNALHVDLWAKQPQAAALLQ